MTRHDDSGRSLTWWLYALDKTNLIVTSLTACFVLYTRSAGVAYFAAGAVSCSLTVKILKRFFRQPRPVVVHVNGRKTKKSYGMPSTHSATITFMATYVCLACTYLPIHPSFPASSITRALPPFIVAPIAATIAVSRIWLGHHTWSQVAVGCGYGLLFAPFWLRLWTNGLNEYGRVVEEIVEDVIGMYVP
ncbi:phosphatidic acid phosphatase type 2/haloperoxidase [Fomes fomentarius]|nr:phosphatidic acid phosphatase type 2/haloperoxidase [Fomes fomentarius]